jgi:manganese/iron transport system ATP-binding protein
MNALNMNLVIEKLEKFTLQAAGVQVEDLAVVYNNGHRAIEKISFDLPAGSITALIGANGSGKSTLFKAIMGFIPHQHGSVSIMGADVKKALKNNSIAYVPQSEEVDWNFPVLVKDVVMMGRFGHMNFLRIASKKDHCLVEQSLTRVNMLDFKDRQIGELSGGQKKRVFLARALAQQSSVILLDEPFTGVDTTTEKQIIILLKKLAKEGKVILVSTHNLNSIPDFCDNTILINKRLLAFGQTKDVFTDNNLAQTFGKTLPLFASNSSV